MAYRVDMDNAKNYQITQDGDTVTVVFANGDPVSPHTTEVARIETAEEMFAAFLADAKGGTA